MNYPKTKRTLMSLAVASAFTSVLVPAHAEEASAGASTTAGADSSATVSTPYDAPAAADSSGASTVVVTGIRKSMQSSMNLKRNSTGIVDGVVAEDIGKFPDTNLAESLQRITGVSIDRTPSGEGSKITVRGVGPDFNLVLLNGRQMPSSNIANFLQVGRGFDFSNLASDAISQLQVYKSSRAETPTGGIGATINVITARPFSNPGFHSSVGIKGVYDTSSKDLPSTDDPGKSLTPEFSGIYSDTFHDKMFGVAVSASYQERNSGYNSAGVPGGWRAFKGDKVDWGTIPQPGQPGSENITNRPGPNDIYSVPQNVNINVNGVNRKRTNGQMVFQFAPVKDLTTTLDYTYAENKVQTHRSELSAWFNFGPSVSSWTNGPVAGPIVYSETIPSGNSDVAMANNFSGTKTELKSTGFNAAWRASDALKLELDTHHSTSESVADNPFGSSGSLGTASFSRGTTTANFSQDFPVLNMQGVDFNAAPITVTGSVFQNSLQRMVVDQTQVSGDWKVLDSSSVKFGAGSTKVDNRSAFSSMQQDNWGGLKDTNGNPIVIPTTMWHLDNMKNYFDLPGSGSPNFTSQFVTFDVSKVAALAASASGHPEYFRPKATWDSDIQTEEKSKSAYGQFNTDWDTAMPLHTAFGMRYEKTDVTSPAVTPVFTTITWVSNNELDAQQNGTQNTVASGSYSYWLPSVDASLDLTRDMVLRASYGENIGRPNWDQIQGATTLQTQLRVNGGTGSAGNPNLKPVKSNNFDLSYEWYYGKQDYFSVGYFNKQLKDYAAQSQFNATPFNLHTPIGGALWNEALSTGGCASTDVTCIRNYIFTNHPTAPGVTSTGVDSNGNSTGTIVGQPGDPIANYQINTFTNQEKSSLNGLELNIQHMFGHTGFGVAANYTYVHSGLKYDNASLNQQFALVGLSNSSNLTGIYEDANWSIRAAYNWRGEFLNSTFDGAGPSPQYTDPYRQIDLSVGYNIDKNLTLQFEGINLNDNYQRIHGRTDGEVIAITQTGRRYMVGARYKF